MGNIVVKIMVKSSISVGNAPMFNGKAGQTLPPSVEINNTPRGLQGECPDAVHGPGGKEESKAPWSWRCLIGKNMGNIWNTLINYVKILKTY